MRLVRSRVREGGPVVASSKLCAHCGWKNEDLTLSDREWWCGGCGALNHRIINAADAQIVEQLAGFELPGVRTWRPCKSGYAGGGR